MSRFPDERYSRPMGAEAGKKQYLADCTGRAERKIFTASRGLSRIADNYEGTTNGLNEPYAGLRGLPTRWLFE